MAEIIQFPKSEYASMFDQLQALREEDHQRKIRALELIASLTKKRKLGGKLFVVFVDDANTHFINLGFTMGELANAVDDVLNYVRKNPKDWDF